MRHQLLTRLAPALLGLGLSLSTEAALTHRYSFATDAKDSVGTANGTAYGNVVFDGSANFDGVKWQLCGIAPSNHRRSNQCHR